MCVGGLKEKNYEFNKKVEIRFISNLRWQGRRQTLHAHTSQRASYDDDGQQAGPDPARQQFVTPAETAQHQVSGGSRRVIDIVSDIRVGPSVRLTRQRDILVGPSVHLTRQSIPRANFSRKVREGSGKGV